MRPKIACVLNPSQEYGNDYVNHLFEGLSAQVGEFEFIVLRGSQWPHWWCKLSLFDPAVRGDILYFDLDTIITGSLADILSVRRLTVLSDPYQPARLASGIMFLPEEARAEIWKAWISDPKHHMHVWRGGGDQSFLAEFWGHTADRWEKILPGQMVSYKAHWRTGTDISNARVVYFHGKPKPKELCWKL